MCFIMCTRQRIGTDIRKSATEIFKITHSSVSTCCPCYIALNIALNSGWQNIQQFNRMDWEVIAVCALCITCNFDYNTHTYMTCIFLLIFSSLWKALNMIDTIFYLESVRDYLSYVVCLQLMILCSSCYSPLFTSLWLKNKNNKSMALTFHSEDNLMMDVILQTW